MISSLKFASLHIYSFFFTSLTQSSLPIPSKISSLLSFSLKIASATHSSFQHTQQLSIIGNLSQWSTMNKLSAIESESGKAHAQAHRLLHIVVIVSLLSRLESSNIWNWSGLLLGCVSTLLVRTRNVHWIVKSWAEEGLATGRMRKRTKERRQRHTIEFINSSDVDPLSFSPHTQSHPINLFMIILIHIEKTKQRS